MVAWYRSGTRVILLQYYRPFFGFLAIWILMSLLGGKYDLRPPKRLKNLIPNIMKINIMALGVVFLLMYFFQLFFYSRFIVFGTILITTTLELILFVSLFYSFKFLRDSDIVGKTAFVTASAKMEEVSGSFFTVQKKDTSVGIPYTPAFGKTVQEDSVMVKLWRKYLDENSKLFSYLNDMLNLTGFSEKRSMILKSATFFNIEHVEEQSEHLFLNLHPINDIRRINAYFIKVNQNLMAGGVYVCCGETITQRYRGFLSGYGKVFGNVFYFFDFLFRRICPKIPFTQGIYFALTKGRNRSLSETEILGRLFFCGFKVIGYQEIEGLTYFVAIKEKKYREDPNPSYGPLIKLKRVGLNGKIFDCYKFRTMHPYSEYLQEYIHEMYSVSESGKFANDFRITEWGRIIRKYWIDEIPQFINLFKGDIRLIGTRAISLHYLSQYPADVREMRLRTKPGLIPVYTADKVTTLLELIHSERRYLERREKSPIKTDAVYLFKALYNILTRKVKSLDCYN
jgi:lipopolysaccharide/colanic/teichoic acid biosynthesis glycosyltransferase